jgi:glutaminase
VATVIESARSEGRAVRPAPGVSPLSAFLARIHQRHASVDDGAVARYIPELGKADRSWFGIAAASLDGQVHAVGDAHVPFTIQSISKPLTYALVLDDHGENAVRAKIGVEPTGDAFNAITLDRASGRPLNPMVNAGAITAAGMLRPVGSETDVERILDGYEQFTGRALRVDGAVEASERATGHRNRAIGHLLRAAGVLDEDPDQAVERYFAQCSVEMTACDLAVIAATLANNGVNPLTGRRAASPGTVRAVLSVMATCGMYDGAGEWLYTIGLPAKSGVSGGILAVVPGRLGLGFFSPPVDPQGNSVRGNLACRDIARELDLHPLGSGPSEGDATRCVYTVAQVGSKRRRSSTARTVLAQNGGRALVIELQGPVSFLAVESLAATQAAAAGEAGQLETLVLDLRRVERIDPPAVHLLAEVINSVIAAGGQVLVSGTFRHRAAVEAMRDLADGALTDVAELDDALELTEDAILARFGPLTDGTVAATAHPLLLGMSEADSRAVVAASEVRSYSAGVDIVRAGDASTNLFLVLAGRLSVTIRVDGERPRRLSTLEAGMVFGETALLGAGRRSADVRTDGEVSCLVLSSAAFDALAKERPAAAVAILRNLLGTATATTARLTQEMAILVG